MLEVFTTFKRHNETNNIPEKLNPGSRTPGIYRWDPRTWDTETPKYLGGTQDLGPPKWDPGVRTPNI